MSVCAVPGVVEKAGKEPNANIAKERAANVAHNLDKAKEFGIISAKEVEQIKSSCGLNEAQNLSFRLMNAGQRINDASPKTAKLTFQLLTRESSLPVRAARAEKEAGLLEQQGKNVKAAEAGHANGAGLLGDVARPAPKLTHKK